MLTYEVRFKVGIPIDATEKQVDDWVRFYLNETGALRGENPLVEYDLEVERGSVYCREVP